MGERRERKKKYAGAEEKLEFPGQQNEEYQTDREDEKRVVEEFSLIHRRFQSRYILEEGKNVLK